jgi:hypothetical protein
MAYALSSRIALTPGLPDVERMAMAAAFLGD